MPDRSTLIHVAAARAYDNLNAATTSTPVNVNVVAISLTSPTAEQGYAVAPADIAVAADVTGAGTIQSVEFFQGNTLVYTDTAAPYSFTWGNVPAGSYTFTARVTDAQNFSVTSAPVSVTVCNERGQARIK
jgi:hypothetical protein